MNKYNESLELKKKEELKECTFTPKTNRGAFEVVDKNIFTRLHQEIKDREEKRSKEQVIASAISKEKELEAKKSHVNFGRMSSFNKKRKDV